MRETGRLGCFVMLAVCGACGNDPTTTISCGTGTDGVLSLGSPVAVTDETGADLRGAKIAAEDHTTVPSGAVSIACADDIVPAGFVALGPAVRFGAEGTWSDRPFSLTLPYKAARMPEHGTRGNVRIVAKRAGSEPYFPAVSNRTLDDADTYASRATFRGSELTTYQVVANADAGTTHMEQFAWNAILGISMGGNASMALALRHPDRFDAFGDMGGEPGPSMVYTLAMVRDQTFGGFCTEASGKLGQLCPAAPKYPEQFESTSDFEHMLYQQGDGVGLTLKRSLYMKASRDLGRALGNPAIYNTMNAYAPPGVDFSYFSIDAATRCSSPTILTGFYDREFNPTAAHDVITFCDGGDSTTLGLGVYDPALPQLDPAELVLAVDLNGNHRRDPGEPVITNAYEPFADVGTDGLADAQEPGYDPVTNPDPNHDDYNYLRNPRGTEGDGDYQVGEPYEDVGIDGVAGTCQAGTGPSCYDYGEGNGKWDLSPNVAGWYDNDLRRRLAAITPDQRDHMAMWFDAGIRDFLNNSVSTNAAIGQALGDYALPFGIYDSFGAIVPGATDATYDFTEVPWTDMPKHGYLRYGNPDATPAEIMGGNGRHVGTANEAIYRIETTFAYVDKHMPDGDREDAFDGGKIMKGLSYLSPTTGRDSPFALYTPPGYDKPENANKRYPVIYVLHGYGQQPDDLVDLSAVIANHMIATEPIETRIQKFIIVYVDGRCRPQKDGVPVDPTGDLCEGGTFYVDAPLGGKARIETGMMELMDHVDANYRTKQPSAAQVTN